MSDRTYLIDYILDGETYSLNLDAKDWAEAERRLEAIKDTAWVQGELVEMVVVTDEDAATIVANADGISNKH